MDDKGNHYVRGWGQPDFTDAEKKELGIGPYYGGAKPYRSWDFDEHGNDRNYRGPGVGGSGPAPTREATTMTGDNNPNRIPFPTPGRSDNPFGNKGENFLREDYIQRHWREPMGSYRELTDEEKEQSRLHSINSGQSATVPPAIAEQRLKEKFEKTLLAQNPSFDIGAGHRGASRNAKIHNLTRNNPNLKEVEAARHILGGVSLPTF